MLKGKRRLFARLDRKLDRMVEVLIVDAFDSLQGKTPQLTGRMAANWRVAIAHPDGSFDFDLAEADIPAARQRAQELAQRARPGDVVFITNAAPYALTVEHRDKMVRLTEAEMRVRLPQLVRQVRGIR